MNQWHAARHQPPHEPATGPETLTEEALRANRADPIENYRAHPLDDEFHRSRSADFTRVTAPLLSAASWGGLGLHSRGNFGGYTQSASRQKWLEVHAGRHEEWSSRSRKVGCAPLNASSTLLGGSCLALTITGLEREDGTGSIPFFHRDRVDRPREVFGGETTLHTGGAGECFVLVPIVPPAGEVL